MDDIERIVKAIKECEYFSEETKGLIYDLIERSTIKSSFYDKEEYYSNCTVHILSNSITGETSIGWWDNDNPPVGISGWEEEEFDDDPPIEYFENGGI